MVWRTTVTGLWSGVQLLRVCGLAYNCYRFLFGVLGFNASATARVISGLWSDVQLLQVCGLTYNCYRVVVCSATHYKRLRVCRVVSPVAREKTPGYRLEQSRGVSADYII